MAISVANTFTSRLWKGEPKVVIRGRFVLGLAENPADGKVFFAPSLYLAGLAVASAGSAFSIQVLGRSVQAGGQPDGPLYAGIQYLDDFDYYALTEPAELPSSPYDSVPGPALFPKIFCDRTLGATAYSKDALSESNARSASSGKLGTLVAPDVRVVLRGGLSRLDVTGMSAVGFPPDNSSVGYGLTTGPWCSQYCYSGPGFSPPGVGWRTTDVHIYDNPGLRGHVFAGGVPVIWG